MTLIEAQKKLLSLKQPALQTIDVSACLNITISNANKILARLEKAGFVKKILRGKWMFHPATDPLFLPEFITFPYPSYISLQTALYYHGMISQIPETTYAVSLARTKKYRTPLGTVSIHHIHPNFFFGFNLYNNTHLKIASPEKALLDVLYLSTTKSHLFTKLPEIEIPREFNAALIYKMTEKISAPRLKSIVVNRLEQLI